MGRAREFLVVVLFCLAAMAIVFYPAVFQGQVIYLEDGAGSDSLDLNIPRRYLAAQCLKKYAEFPLWEPRIGCGAPLFAESEAGVLHPALLFFFQDNLTLAANLTILSAILIAMLGSYALSRRLKLSPFASGIAAAVYGLGPTMLYATQALNIMHVIAWVPGCLAIIHALAETAEKRYWFLLVIVWTLQIFASHFEAFAICQICCWLYIIWLLLGKNFHLACPPSRLAAYSLLALIFTLCLGSVQILTTYEFTQKSTREAAISLEVCQNNSANINRLLSFIDPFYRTERYKHLANYLARFSLINFPYLGLLPLLLCFCSFSARRRRLSVGLWIMAIFFFVVSLGPRCGVYYLLWRFVPFMDSFRYPVRFTIPLICLLSVIAAIGAQNISDWIDNRYNKRLSKLILSLVTLIICIDAWYINDQVQGYLPQAWSSPPSVLQRIESYQRIYSPYSCWNQRKCLNSNPVNGKQRQNMFWEHRSLISPGMAPLWNIAAPDDYIFYGLGIVLKNASDMQTVLHVIAEHLLEADAKETALLAPRFADWLRLLGITHLITPLPLPDSWPKSEFISIQSAPIQEISGENVYIYALARPLNKVRLVPVLQKGTPANSIDIEKIAEIHEENALYEPDIANPASIGTVRIELETNHKLIINTSCGQNAYLVISNTYDPNWQAAIDGQPALVERTDLTLQSVAVPQGEHRIELRYISPAFETGWKISLTALILLIFAALYALAKAKTLQKQDDRDVKA
ncbi:MAG: YfhO family protein [bacterium]|nr:YfhO family protein [bacterium]